MTREDNKLNYSLNMHSSTVTKTETHKKQKYELLAKELALTYKAEVRVIPYVITWDGLVSYKNENYCKEMELPIKVQRYIMHSVIKDTLKSIIGNNY
ncbi:hypothetical protein ENBRE01_3519, partial [Enteropsectra breve]